MSAAGAGPRNPGRPRAKERSRCESVRQTLVIRRRPKRRRSVIRPGRSGSTLDAGDTCSFRAKSSKARRHATPGLFCWRTRSTTYGIQVLVAASLALNQASEGSSPSGPTEMHWSSSGQDSAPVMRIRRFESGPVLSLFDNSAVTTSAHDVSAAGTDWQDASWSALPGRKSGFDSRSRALHISGRGKVWHSACLGRTRSLVQIQPS